MTAEIFWTRWLKITMLLMIFAGVLFPVLYYWGPTEFIDHKFEQAFRRHSLTTEQLHHLKQWMVPIIAIISISWSGTMLYIANHAFKQRKKWAWRSIFYPILAWFIIDNGSSLYYGVLFDLTINTILFFQLAAPLLFLRYQFFPKKEGIG